MGVGESFSNRAGVVFVELSVVGKVVCRYHRVDMENEPTILAIETSASLASVALGEGPTVLAEEPFNAQLRHAGQLVPAIEQLLRRYGRSADDLDELYLSAGPGSFTGLRLAVTAAKALAFALPRLRVVAVPSNDVLALNAFVAAEAFGVAVEHVAVVIDAQQGMVYGACYRLVGGSERGVRGASADEGGSLVPGMEPIVAAVRMRPEALLAASPRPLHVLGEAVRRHSEVLGGRDIVCLSEEYSVPHAANVHRCGYRRARAGCFCDPYALEPLYLRRPEAVVRWEERHGKGSS